MHEVLSKNLLVIKEHVGMFKAASNYDIYDPETNQIILECREDNLGMFTKMLRFTDWKRLTPFDIEIRTPDGQRLLRITRGVALFLSKVKVLDADDQVIGGFQQKLFSVGGAFNVLDSEDRPLCTLKGKWTGWDFRFASGDQQFARVSKKWAGMGKEMFTTADTYALEISDTVPPDNPVRLLILAAVMCIDMVLKE